MKSNDLFIFHCRDSRRMQRNQVWIVLIHRVRLCSSNEDGLRELVHWCKFEKLWYQWGWNCQSIHHVSW